MPRQAKTSPTLDPALGRSLVAILDWKYRQGDRGDLQDQRAVGVQLPKPRRRDAPLRGRKRRRGVPNLLTELCEAPFAAFRLRPDGRIAGLETHPAVSVRILVESGDLLQWRDIESGEFYVIVSVPAQERLHRLPDFTGGLRDVEGLTPHSEASLDNLDLARMAAALGGKYHGRVRRKL